MLNIFHNFADMSKYTEHFINELKQIVENLNTNPEKVESIGAFVACAKFDYDFIKHIICGIKETWVMDKAIQVISDTWNEYLRKDEDICYIITYTDDYSIETGGVYEVKKPLMKMPKFLDIERSLSEIKESELNRREINVKYEKELSNIKNDKTFESDFDHLKDYHKNTDLNFYLSDEHWNFHVNRLIHTYLKVRHNNIELGLFLEMALSYYVEQGRDYSSIYGVMFNKAYELCSIVLASPVPDTIAPKLLKQASEVCEDKNAATIISYHIMVMVNYILCFANDRNDKVGRFLHSLSLHDDFGVKIDNKIQHFETYIKVGLNTIAGVMIDSGLQPPGKLRPGYDYKTQDKYLRKTIPWYNEYAKKLEKRVEEADKNKIQVVTDIENVEKEIKKTSLSWDDSFDFIFNKKVKPQEIYNALKDAIPDTKLLGRPQHYVSFRILKILKYVKSDTTVKDYLKWINLHFNYEWSSDNDLKFRINNKKEFDKLHPSKWKNINTKSDIEESYYNYAIALKNVFTQTIENGKKVDDSESYEHLKDRPRFLCNAFQVDGDQYLAKDKEYINNGK